MYALENYQNERNHILYQKSKQLLERFLKEELPLLTDTPRARLEASQQLSHFESICENMAESQRRVEGHNNKPFLKNACGLSQKALGRYRQLRKFLPEDIISQRTVQLNELVGMLEYVLKNSDAKKLY